MWTFSLPTDLQACWYIHVDSRGQGCDTRRIPSWNWRRIPPSGQTRQTRTWSRDCWWWIWCLSASCNRSKSRGAESWHCPRLWSPGNRRRSCHGSQSRMIGTSELPGSLPELWSRALNISVVCSFYQVANYDDIKLLINPITAIFMTFLTLQMHSLLGW